MEPIPTLDIQKIFYPKLLTEQELEWAQDTISSNTFYMMVGHALVAGEALSVVRMGDGECQLMQDCIAAYETGSGDEIVDSHDDAWLERMGVLGIAKKLLKQRLEIAANACTHFAPSLSGIQLENFRLYDLFDARTRYVDNFFCNAWTEGMKIQLFQQAKHVLFIHRSLPSADAMQIRAKYALGVKVTYLHLSNWQEAEGVIDQASKIDAPLVLFSAGPASKYIGPEIAMSGNLPKVTLDIGNAADYWLLSSLKDIPNGRR